MCVHDIDFYLKKKINLLKATQSLQIINRYSILKNCCSIETNMENK